MKQVKLFRNLVTLVILATLTMNTGWAANESNVIAINRSKTFNPVEFCGEGWSIINAETDKRSVAITKLDLKKIEFKALRVNGGTSITGEEKLAYMKKSNHIRLDVNIFLTLWENQSLIPEEWKEKVGDNVRFISFDGTVLKDMYGNRYVLFLYWFDGKWRWNSSWLKSIWHENYPVVIYNKK